jgi:hypothetical protein
VLLVILVVWTVLAVAAALVMGAAARTAKFQERARRVPSYVPEQWSLTPSR